MQHFNKYFVWYIFIRLCFRNKIHDAILYMSVCHTATTFEKTCELVSLLIL